MSLLPEVFVARLDVPGCSNTLPELFAAEACDLRCTKWVPSLLEEFGY